MSSVINSKQEKEKKAALAEERRKRERRRLKEMGAVNGADTPEDDDGEEEKVNGLPVRQHHHKNSRSRSPALAGHEHGHGSINSALNGTRGTSPHRIGGGNAKDSFLNYFFGKDGGMPGGTGTSNTIGSISATAGTGHRHVSHHVEPSFSQSIRRGDNRIIERSLPQHDNDSTYDGMISHRDMDYNAPLVSPFYPRFYN